MVEADFFHELVSFSSRLWAQLEPRMKLPMGIEDAIPAEFTSCTVSVQPNRLPLVFHHFLSRH